MINRKRNLIYLFVITISFFLITIFTYMLYASYFDSAEGNFTGFILYDETGYDDASDTKKARRLTDSLTQWASEHNAVLFYKEIGAPGIAVVDYAGWFNQNMASSFDGQTPDTAIINRDDTFLNMYISENTLFSHYSPLKIVGNYCNNASFSFIEDSYFFFSFSNIDIYNTGLLFTNKTDASSLNELLQTVIKQKKEIDFQTYGKNKKGGILSFLSQIIFGDFLTKSSFFAFFGVVFCLFFSSFMMYHDNSSAMTIHHKFGAAYRNLFVKFWFLFICSATTGTLFGFLLALLNLHLYNHNSYINIAIRVFVANGVCASLIQTICFFSWLCGQKKGGKY